MRVLARRVSRIGVMTLTLEGDAYFMHIRNRSYESKHPVPAERVPRWIDYLTRRPRR